MLLLEPPVVLMLWLINVYFIVLVYVFIQNVYISIINNLKTSTEIKRT